MTIWRKRLLKVWYWLVPILNFFDYILTPLPYVIYISWFFYTFVIYYTQWYANNRIWIDFIDTILCGIVTAHSLYFMKLREYSYTVKIICLAMLLVLALQIQYYYIGMSDESYIRVYKAILWSSLSAIVINVSLTESEKR